MPVETATQLRQHLFDAYDGFADKRIRNVERDEPFIVDDRGQGDYDARKQLFLWFTLIFVTVRSEGEVDLLFRGGTPNGPEVKAWFENHAAQNNNHGIVVAITRDNFADLKELALAFERITQRKYDVAAYKYVVPRVSASIKKLFYVLEQAWS